MTDACHVALFGGCNCRDVKSSFMNGDLKIEFSSPGERVVLSPFKISYSGHNYIDICETRDYNITSLPARIKSPNFPMAAYPDRESCYCHIRTGLPNITVSRSLSLQIS